MSTFESIKLFDCVRLFRQQALFNVLSAYSMYNTEVGYCQGMSQIAALLLMYMNEEVSIENYANLQKTIRKIKNQSR